MTAPCAPDPSAHRTGRAAGSGGGRPPLVILHGLLGSAEDWRPVARALAQRFTVHVPELRNHGAALRSERMDYAVMAADTQAFMQKLGLGRASLLGHSMGGKTAMQFASMFPAALEKLVVVDIAPRGYPPVYAEAIEALARLDLGAVASLRDADARLAASIHDRALRRFLLKRLKHTGDGAYRWQVNLEAIRRSYRALCAPLQLSPWAGACLFIRGGRSDYIRDADWAPTRSVFPQARRVTIDGAGHWVHADAPVEFVSTVMKFLGEPASSAGCCRG
ncbi:MAG: alpha/beta fold hydrolase [Desulfobacterales bacterium]|jgi:pimeloyl-ACP methyl ester carboxylesterase|nr:alpha/beta fold hydrolase [Desulfobacterales bacterium]